MATNLGTPQNWAPVAPSGGLTVQDLMGQIQNGQQQPIDLQSLMPKVVQGNPQNSAGPFTASMFQSAPTGGSYGQQLPLWRQALNFVDRPRNAVDTAINDALTAHQGLLGDLGAGAKGFMNGLTDKQYTDFGNILDTLGWKPQNENAPVHNIQTMKGNFNTNANLDTGLHKVGSFLGDVITDPLSYLTMGSEGVAKSGIQAGLKAAGEAVGKDALKGVGNDIGAIADTAGKKSAENLANTVAPGTSKTYSQLANEGTLDPQLFAQKQAEAYQNTSQNVMNAAKNARFEANKSAVNFNVPFTNINKSIINKPSFLQPFEKTIGETGAGNVRDILSSLGVDNPQAQDQLVQQAFEGVKGVKNPIQSVQDLTPSMVQHLLDNVGSVGKTTTQDIVNPTGEVLKPATTETVTNMVPRNALSAPVDNAQILKMPTGASSKANQNLQWLYDVANAQGIPAGKEAEFVNELMNMHGGNLEQVLQDLNKAHKQGGTDLANIVNRVKGASQLGYSPLRELVQLDKEAPLVDGAKGLKAPNSVVPGNSTLKTIYSPVESTIEHPAEFGASNVMDTVAKPQGQMTNDIIQALKGFTPDAGGHSALGWALRDSPIGKAIIPRAGEGTNTVWDALGTQQGRQFDMARNMGLYNDMMKQLPKDAEQWIPYLTEGELPMALTDAEKKQLTDMGVTVKSPTDFTINNETLQKVLQMRQKLNTGFAQGEMNAGTLDQGRILPNYDYMMRANRNLTPEELDQMLQDPMLAPYLGRSSKNTSNIARGQFKNHAQWQNAVRAIGQDLQDAKAMGKSAEDIQKLQDHYDQLKGLYEPDSTKTLNARYAKNVRSQTFGEMQKALRQQGLVRDSMADIPNEFNKGSFQQLNDEYKKVAKALDLPENTYVHKDVLNALKKVNSLMDGNTASKFLDNFNGIMNLWKSLPILYSPSHLKTRFVGDVMNAMMGGATMKDANEAEDLYDAAMSGKMTAEQEKQWKLAVDKGIVRGHAGQNADIYENTATNNKIQHLNNILYGNKFAQGMGNTLNKMDNLSRLALFLRGMKSYGDAGKAAMNVKKYLFNYNELTTTEKGIRSVVPFYTWMRNNLPLMVSQLAKNPRYFQTANRAISQLSNGQPYNPYAADFLRIPDTNYMFDARMPMQDLDMLSQPGHALVNSMPFLSMPFEQQTNTDFFSGMPIDQTKIAGEPAGAGAMSKFILGQALAGGPATAIQDMVGNNKPWWENLFNIGIGGLTNQDPAKIQKEANWQQKAQQQLQKKLAKQQAQKQAGG